MALNPYFLQGSSSEQNLVQDLINEQLTIYGVEVHYLPRQYATTSTIIREVIENYNESVTKLDTQLYQKTSLLYCAQTHKIENNKYTIFICYILKYCMFIGFVSILIGFVSLLVSHVFIYSRYLICVYEYDLNVSYE